MFAEDLALQTRVAFLKQRSLKELCRVAIYFDACCPKEWEAFMGSLDEGELKEKLQEEQRLRRGFYDLVYLAACKFAENHESAISFVRHLQNSPNEWIY